MSEQEAEADAFDDFSSSLLNVGKTTDDGNISIFTNKGVTVLKWRMSSSRVKVNRF